MSLQVRVVRSQTGSGTKPAFRGQAEDWICACPGEMFWNGVEGAVVQRGFLVRCPDCGMRRPS